MKPCVLLIPFLTAALLTGCGSSKYHDPSLTAAYAAETEAAAESEAETEAKTETVGPADDIEESSAAAQAAGESEAAPLSVSVLFAGDILFSDHVLNAYSKAGGVSGILDEGFRSAIADADYFAANEEFPFSSRGTAAPDKQYTFRLPEEKVSIMNELGVDLVTLANNHALDFGTDALLDTCSTLDQAGILHVGAGANSEEARKPEIVELNGIRIGFIGASRVIPVSSWTAGANSPGMLTAYDDTLLRRTIEETRPLCDYLVVYLHWGVERAEMPVDHQTSLGRRCIDSGADLVIGSHPHVLQGLEYYEGKPIVYSLGNFIFGSSIPKTMLLELTLESTGEDRLSLSPSLRLIPGTSSGGFTRRLTDQGEINSFFQYIESISFDIAVDENGLIIPKQEGGGSQ